MPFRDRLKKTFSRNSREGSDGSAKQDSRKNSDIWYKPGEKMPPPKYRRPVAKEHKEKLEAFSFGNAWRRKSDQSLYSPMGSRMPSRRNSLRSLVGRKSFQASRSNSKAKRTVAPGPAEGPDDPSDPTNVGLSRQTSRENRNISAGSSASRPLTNDTNSTTPPNEKPFTQQELTLALQRSHLQVPS